MSASLQLNSYGDTIELYGFDMTSPDQEKVRLRGELGSHYVCEGRCTLRDISETHQAIVCRCCNLRVVIPSNIKTYGALFAHFKKKLKPRSKGVVSG